MRMKTRSTPSRARARLAAFLGSVVLLAATAPAALAIDPSITATCTVLDSGRALISGTVGDGVAGDFEIVVYEHALAGSTEVGFLHFVGSGEFELTTAEGYVTVAGRSLGVELRSHPTGILLDVTTAVCVALVRSVTDLTNELAASGVLGQGEANSLLVKVDNATASATKGNVEAAIRQLEAFKHEIEALYQSGRITQAERDAIVVAADRQIAGLRSGA